MRLLATILLVSLVAVMGIMSIGSSRAESSAYMGTPLPSPSVSPIDADLQATSWIGSSLVGTINGVPTTLIADSTVTNAAALKALIPALLRVRYYPDTLKVLVATNGSVIPDPMPTPCPIQAATFVALDITTQGTWKTVYGANGYSVMGDSTSYPAYATVTMTGATPFTWVASTSDVRALQKAGTASDRVAAVIYSSTTFMIDVNLTDGATHKVALYCLDWDSSGRAERIDIVDATTSLLLDSRTVSAFSGGQYVVWNLVGHVSIRVTTTGGPNAAMSGIFFDSGGPGPSPTPTPTPTPVTWTCTMSGGTLIDCTQP